MEWEFLIPWLWLIRDGLIITVEVTMFGALMGLALGIILAIGDIYGGRKISTIIKFYVEFFRGSPIIAQLFIFYYTIPALFHTLWDPLVAGLLVFSLNSAAYQKGYVKGAMEAIFEDQMTAGLSIGLSKAQVITYVILPQALRLVIPAWGNEFSSIARSSAALLAIGMLDLAGAAKTIASWTFRPLETYAFAAVIYLIWISVTLKISDILYERMKIPGIEIAA
jgi:polar amino acid transport system permease protein